MSPSAPSVWTQLSPFFLAIALSVVSLVLFRPTFNRVANAYASSTGVPLDQHGKEYLRRACVYFADFTQLYAGLVPPLVALHFNTSGSVGVINALYWTCLGVTVLAALTFVRFLSAKKYSRESRVVTPVAIMILTVNVIAMVITFIHYAI